MTLDFTFMMEKKYDLKKTLKKGLISFLIVFLTGLISVWQNDPKYLVLIPVITMILNYLKNR